MSSFGTNWQSFPESLENKSSTGLFHHFIVSISQCECNNVKKTMHYFHFPLWFCYLSRFFFNNCIITKNNVIKLVMIGRRGKFSIPMENGFLLRKHQTKTGLIPESFILPFPWCPPVHQQKKRWQPPPLRLLKWSPQVCPILTVSFQIHSCRWDRNIISYL